MKNPRVAHRTNPAVATVVGGENQLVVSDNHAGRKACTSVAPIRQPAVKSPGKPCSGVGAASAVTPAPIRKATNCRSDGPNGAGAARIRRDPAPLVTGSSNNPAASSVTASDELCCDSSEASPAADTLTSSTAGATIRRLHRMLSDVNAPPSPPEFVPATCSCGSSETNVSKGVHVHHPFRFRARRVSLFSEESKVAYENARNAGALKHKDGCDLYDQKVRSSGLQRQKVASWKVGSNTPDHLVDCGPGCTCAASADSDYLDLLSKVRRFLPRRAAGVAARSHSVRE